MTKRISGTKEWAASNFNIQRGCSHNCRYCYSRANALRFGTISNPDQWATEEINLKALEQNFGKRQGTIMFPTTHDITPANVDAALVVLKKMLKAGNKVLIVSKPHLSTIQILCSELTDYKDQILFRFTMGTRCPAHLRFWEPGAPLFQERLDALLWAYAEGYTTSVSMEPLLETDEEEVIRLVNCVAPFVRDAIWIGKANLLIKRMGESATPEDLEVAIRLMESQSDERIKALYERLKNHPKVKWKESIKEVLGLPSATEVGQDI